MLVQILSLVPVVNSPEVVTEVITGWITRIFGRKLKSFVTFVLFFGPDLADVCSLLHLKVILFRFIDKKRIRG